ncbi:hypothetical protein [Sulfitobacter sp.]|uniref:hypothetical protein n=1 Tax=Sulfitobacter sp. TaxID=1903071 RepID=UPI0032991BA5
MFEAFGGKGRGAILACFMWVSAVGAAFTHGLPGSVLTLSQTEGMLDLEVQIPLEELVIAGPALRVLEDVPRDQGVSEDQRDLLATYFRDHLALERGEGPLPLSLERASLRSVQHHDVGSYDLLVLDFTAVLSDPKQEIFPLTLFYDAVMHEVRSHKATVYWSEDDADPVGLARFLYRPTDGAMQGIRLDMP